MECFKFSYLFKINVLSHALIDKYCYSSTIIANKVKGWSCLCGVLLVDGQEQLPLVHADSGVVSFS